MSQRANVLAERILQGAKALADYAHGLTDAQWTTPILPDGRTAGVLVHHVANMYPIELDLARMLAKGQSITDVTWPVVAEINAKHAHEQKSVSRSDALALLKANSQAAADAVRTFTDAELDSAAPLSLNYGAPMTAQFWIEAHPLYHSFHHLGTMRAVLG